MTETEQPQLYLITPPEFDLNSFPAQLSAVLETTDVACIRLALATQDEDRILRAADALREIAHAHDVAMVIDTHVMLAQRLGLDGVHLVDGARSIRFARKTLGPEAIIGAYCGDSRHEGINAAEAGADYISFGPVGPNALGDGTLADTDLFQWWSEMIELPVVAEGALDDATIRRLAHMTDFFAIGEEIWRQNDPVDALRVLMQGLSETAS
ncbi:thiamine phosphate synthase [Puniceibacterium sp. IMCC21224]|uniref:thiamine phosphate synthase n=1 Tax=Puniceibacterium sp. IMCC21224 TaxID=1618204 RepID=UPI00064DC638|nr:thiamine phosphate synthase [Puniceibacterium sp. IMCC21224]KMK66857.1 thiamine monophosphate synthase [Puniceibacterium sp. IMCC21224]